MYNTTSQFIANARALKTALLTCLLVNESLRIETGSAVFRARAFAMN